MSLITGIEYLSKTRSTYEDELSFANMGLKLNTAEDVKDIVNKILSMKSIKVLRLEGNTIAPAAAEELGKALRMHPELERFIGNDIFTTRLKDEIPLALRSICGAFETSGSKLVELNLSDNAFGPIGLDALVTFLASSTCFNLKEMRMHNNGLGPEGAKKLANALISGYKNSNSKLLLKVFICGRNRLELEGSRAICEALKMMGSLEEIQMPQNGIRPNGIENIADALSSNPNLRIINMNDNTFTKRGSEAISKALINLKNLEYVNFGDCLLKSKGALLLVRSLINNKNLKELILSFNEIDATNGVEISEYLVNPKHHFDNMKFIDLNGNKFGEQSIEISNMFSKFNENILGTLSEDEGDGDDDTEDEDVDNSEEEDEEDEEYGDEDDDEYEDYEDEELDEDEEEEEEYEEENDLHNKYGNMNINNNVQQKENLFANLINKQSQQQPLFGNLSFQNNQTVFSQQNPIDIFLKSPLISTFAFLTNEHLVSYFKSNKYASINFLIILQKLSTLNIDPRSGSSNESDSLIKGIRQLFKAYFDEPHSCDTFTSEFLVFFGLLKSEDKKFKPAEINENLNRLLTFVFKENLFPIQIKENLVLFLKLSSTSDDKKRNKDQILNCLN